MATIPWEDYLNLIAIYVVTTLIRGMIVHCSQWMGKANSKDRDACFPLRKTRLPQQFMLVPWSTVPELLSGAFVAQLAKTNHPESLRLGFPSTCQHVHAHTDAWSFLTFFIWRNRGTEGKNQSKSAWVQHCLLF
eukprot:4311190-Amphidinium_carterae.1